MEEKCFIYYLIENNTPIYVGKCKNLLKRLGHHKWRLNNYNIEIEELDYINISDWKFWEQYWISQFKTWGFKLENKNNGGGGLTKHNKNSIEASRSKRKGQKRPNTSIKLKGRIISQKTKDKISLGNSKPKPENFGKTISIANKGKIHSIESNEKRRNKQLGIPKPGVSEKTKGIPRPWAKNNKGKKRENEFLNNLSKRKSKPVIQMDLEGNFIKEWESSIQIAKFYNKSAATICNYINGKQKSNFIWKIKS